MTIPLSLYIHIPWCVQKCPYCDFNSHAVQSDSLPEEAYIERLLLDLDSDLTYFHECRPLTSIFIGGGTPSLFSDTAIQALLDGVRERLTIKPTTEITLEANPGTVDENHFHGYRQAGVNRLSIGVQSFHTQHLRDLGRIHNPQEALRAVDIAKQVGFDNINIDMMFGLPQQTIAQALADIEQAIALDTEHLSYYQLTLEPNTAFAHRPPLLPDEQQIDSQFDAAVDYLTDAGFQRYEVSAWTRGRKSQHNYNYWQHGDYLGIGAGAHGKITHQVNDLVRITRTTKSRSPKQYLGHISKKTLAIHTPLRTERVVTETDKIFEFMLNTLRLIDGFDRRLMLEHGLFTEARVLPILQNLADKGLLVISEQRITPTDLGKRFINDMVSAFLP